MKNRSLAKEIEAAALLVTEHIAQQILVVRGHKVMIDADLAALYGVTTKRFNEQVKRNLARFPADFMFRLSDTEHAALRSQFATSSEMPETPRRYWLSARLLNDRTHGGLGSQVLYGVGLAQSALPSAGGAPTPPRAS